MRLVLLLTLLAGLVQWRWVRRRTPRFRTFLLALLFFLLFLITDGSATASQSWQGAPPTYWPVGGAGYAPLIFVSGLVAAVVNYQWHIFGGCGIPGVAALYVWFLWAAALLCGR